MELSITLFSALITSTISVMSSESAAWSSDGWTQSQSSFRAPQFSISYSDPTTECLSRSRSGGGRSCEIFNSCCNTQCNGVKNSSCQESNGWLTARCTCTQNGDGFSSQGSTVWESYRSNEHQATRPPTTRPPTVEPMSTEDSDEGGIFDNAPYEPRIVGGVQARKRRWPWQASLLKNGQHHCGATLIDWRHVVTAAHCVGDNYPYDYQIALGMTNRDVRERSSRLFQVQAIKVHPNFNTTTKAYDVAVLRLANTVTPSRSIATVPLARNDAQPSETCYVTGWGETRGTGDNRYLLEAAVQIISRDTCRDANYWGSLIRSSMICAGYPGQDACQGDSGGPLVCRRNGRQEWELQGIVSWGSGNCGDVYKPAVYTRVPFVRNWIMSNSNLRSASWNN